MEKVTYAEHRVGGQLYKCEAERIRMGKENGREQIEVRVFTQGAGLFAKRKLVRVDYYDCDDARDTNALFAESLKWVE